jgi:hypothetical protein
MSEAVVAGVIFSSSYPQLCKVNSCQCNATLKLASGDIFFRISSDRFVTVAKESKENMQSSIN